MALRFPDNAGKFVESVRAGRPTCDTPPNMARKVLRQWCDRFDPSDETYTTLEGSGRDGTMFVWGCDIPHGGIQPSTVASDILPHTLRAHTAVELRGKRLFGKDSNLELHTGKARLRKDTLRSPNFKGTLRK